MSTGRKLLWVICFISIALVSNIHLVTGSDPTILLFETSKVSQGEWWRIFTHPFVHVSWYHLVLDSAAVLLLWRELCHLSGWQKLMASFTCAAMSLFFAVCFSPYIDRHGLCGFSGLAHGLTVLLGLSWLSAALHNDFYRRVWLMVAGFALTFTTIVKALVEALSGKVIFADYHLGNLGIPVVEAHVGGVLGGCVSFFLLYLWRRKSFDPHVKMVDKLDRDKTQISNDCSSHHPQLGGVQS